MTRRSPSRSDGAVGVQDRHRGARCGACASRGRWADALDLAQPRRRPVDLDRLGAGVLGDQLARRADRHGLAVGHDRHAGRRGARPPRCSACSSGSRRPPSASGRSAPRAPGAPAGRDRPSARRAASAAGSCSSARAISSRRRMPPESSSTLECAALDQVGELQRALDRVLSLALPARGRGARRPAGSARRSATRRGCRAGARRPSRRAPAWSPRAAHSPGSRISPSSAITCAVSAFIVVDLPAPLGPSRPTHVPNGTSRSRPSTAVSEPNRLTNPRSLIADSSAAGAAISSAGRGGRSARRTRRPWPRRASCRDTAAAPRDRRRRCRAR